MSRVAFKQADIQRMLRAAKAEGYSDPAVEKLPGGGLRLLTRVPPQAASKGVEIDLDGEWEAWLRKNGDG